MYGMVQPSELTNTTSTKYVFKERVVRKVPTGRKKDGLRNPDTTQQDDPRLLLNIIK